MNKSYMMATLLLCLQILFWCSPWAPVPTENFRMRFNAPVAREITTELFNGLNLAEVSLKDDLGMPLFWALGAHLEGMIPDEYHAAEDLPALWQVWCIAIFLLVQWITTTQALQFFGSSWGLLPLGFFWFQPLIQRNILSFDVYLFPLYGALLSLSLFTLIWPTKFCQMSDTAPERQLLKQLLIATVPLIGMFEWMRTGSTVPLIFIATILLCQIMKKKFPSRTLSLAILAALAIGYLPGLVFKESKHVLYHSLCAGLFEEGGVKDPTRGWLPKALYPELAQNAKSLGLEETSGWSDHIQYQIAQLKNPQIELYSAPYHQLMKEYVLNAMVQKPFAFATFMGRRMWRMLYLWPYWPLSSAGQLQESAAPFLAYSVPWCVLLVLCWLLVAWIRTPLPIIFLVMLAYLAAPGLLVHSTYTIYTIAFRVLAPWWCWTMLFLLARSSRGSAAETPGPVPFALSFLPKSATAAVVAPSSAPLPPAADQS